MAGDFSGRWTLADSDNFEAYLDAIGEWYHLLDLLFDRTWRRLVLKCAGITVGFFKHRTGGWEFDRSHGAGISSPSHWQQVEEQAPKPVDRMMCFLLTTFVPVQKLCVNIYTHTHTHIYIYIYMHFLYEFCYRTYIYIQQECHSVLVKLRSGVTGFATIYATGSQRFMLQVRNDERDEFNLRQKKRVNLTYHWLMHVIISPLNTIELCRTFRRDVATTKRQIVTLEVKNIRNNRQKSMISNFDENWRQWWACGCRHLSFQLFSIHPWR